MVKAPWAIKFKTPNCNNSTILMHMHYREITRAANDNNLEDYRSVKSEKQVLLKIRQFWVRLQAFNVSNT